MRDLLESQTRHDYAIRAFHMKEKTPNAIGSEPSQQKKKLSRSLNAVQLKVIKIECKCCIHIGHLNCNVYKTSSLILNWQID